MSNFKKQTDIFGRAITAFYEHQDSEDIIVHSEDFEDDCIPVPYLLRSYEEMPKLEQKALELCSGKVLDIGCGAGSHARYLQDKRNLEVTAIDTSSGAIDICRKRGVQDARKISFADFQGGPYDTLLFLMNGIGIVGKLKFLDNFFLKIKSLLAEEGQVLLDSSDLIYLFDEEPDGGYWIDASKGYYGELSYQLSYKGETSESFPWLYLDFESLSLAATKNGLDCQKVLDGDHFDYLARITRK